MLNKYKKDRRIIMQEKKAGPISQFLGSIAITIMGIAFFFMLGVPSYITGKESKSWPQVQGKIIESKIVTTRKVVDGKNQTN